MPSATPLSVLRGLPPLKWRGKVHKFYDSADFEFEHGHAIYRYYRVSGAAHNWLGMGAIPMPFKLYFMNSLWDGAFPDRWNEWRDLLFDGESYTLEHPLLGPVNAVVRRGSVKCSAMSPAGVTVDVTFETDLKDPNKQTLYAATESSVKALAQQAAAACSSTDINWPSEEPVTDLFDVLAEIDGWLYSTNLTLEGAVNQWQGKLDKFISITQGQSPGTKDWVAGTALIMLWDALNDVKNSAVATARPTATASANEDTTVDALADAQGNTLGEFMGLNLTLLGNPIVKRGTPYRYYTA